MKNNKNPKKLTTIELFTKSSIIAVIVTVPSLAAFGLGWYFLNDLIQGAIIGAIVHFIALGFSFKISKKFFVRQPQTETDL